MGSYQHRSRVGTKRRGWSGEGPSFIAPDWEMLRDFNSGPAGASTNAQADGFSGDAWASVYSSDQVHSGSFSGKMTIQAGTGGFGDWGGRINFPSVFVKGDTLWYQHYYYMPDSYTIQTVPQWLKYLRFLTQDSSNANIGYLDLYLNDDDAGIPTTTYRWIMEGQGQWVVVGPNRRYLRDQWVRQTVRVDFSDIPAALGGTGRVRHWENGMAMLDSAVTIGNNGTWLKTLNADTHRCVYHLLHTYWNNGNAPVTQSSYVDDIRIAKNGRPTWTLDLIGAD